MKAGERVAVVPQQRAYEISPFERTKGELIPTPTAERPYPLCVKIIENADRLQFSCSVVVADMQRERGEALPKSSARP